MNHRNPTLRQRLATVLRTALLASSALSASAVLAQSPESLPSGLVRQGDVITMAPIQDGEEVGAAVTAGGERRTGLVRILSAADHALFERAFDAADRDDWATARALADQGQDQTARLLIQWRTLLDRNSGAPFSDIDTFLKTYPDWPNRDTLYARAERAIDPNMDGRAMLGWFGDRAPVSNIGKIRLGEALIATGSMARGQDLIRQGWTDGDFEPDQETAIIRRDGDVLTDEADRERLGRLITRDDLAAARRELPRVPGEAKRIAEARLRIRIKSMSTQRMLDVLSAFPAEDPGIVFDRVRLLREHMDVDKIPKLVVRAPSGETAAVGAARWWGELNLDIREAMRTDNYAGAYAIAAHTGLKPDDGTGYSDAQFLAGWIASRFLKDPQSALVHFENFAQAVSRPISRARARYWEGRCYEALGDTTSAWHQYKLATEDPDTFYGQLALARIAAAPGLHVHDQEVDGSGLRADFEQEGLTRAIRVLADLGQVNFLREFAAHDVAVYSDPRHVKLLAEELVRMGFPDVAVHVAKEAGYNGVSLLAYSHPVMAIPAYTGPGTAPEAALVLGIIRQETEFDPDAVSSAGARGIVQIMPSSVRHIAAMGGLPYRPNDLTTDPAYDLKLGMTELAGEISDWSGSYILAIAAYNAGPTNVRRWIGEFGDPRDASVDPVDWIEEIPFGETRNYVQRVLENIEVYRNRLAGRDQPLQILTDLYRPDAVQGAPLQYVPPAQGPSDVPVPIPKPASEGSANGEAAGSGEN